MADEHNDEQMIPNKYGRYINYVPVPGMTGITPQTAQVFFSHSVGPFSHKGSISKVGRCVSIAVKRPQLIECGPAGKQHLMEEENP